MTDMEKVIKAFDDAKEPLVWLKDDEYTVGYNNGIEAGKDIALSMLEEQEPIVPGLEQDADGIYSTCGNCRTRLWKMFGLEFEINPDAMPKFCPQCGKKVKWDE